MGVSNSMGQAKNLANDETLLRPPFITHSCQELDTGNGTKGQYALDSNKAFSVTIIEMTTILLGINLYDS